MHQFQTFLDEKEEKVLGIAPAHLVNHLEKNDSVGLHHLFAKSAEEVKTHINPSLDKFQPSHRKAILDWAGDLSRKGNYRRINSHLRFGNPVSTQETATIHHLDDMTENHKLAQDVHVYRGIHRPLSDHIDKLRIGDKYIDKGFLSTSTNPTRAAYFAQTENTEKNGKFMHIHLKKGASAAYLGHEELAPFSEHEMLLPRNAHLQFLGTTQYRHPHLNSQVDIHHFVYHGDHGE